MQILSEVFISHGFLESLPQEAPLVSIIIYKKVSVYE